MLADTLVFNDCKFTPDSRYVIIEKPSKGLPTEALDRFEVETLLSILSLFSNKIIRVVASKKIPVGYSFTCLVEDGNFTDFENAQTNFKKLENEIYLQRLNKFNR